MYKLIFYVLIAALVSACTTAPKFQTSEVSRNFQKGLDSNVLIVIEYAHLLRAFRNNSEQSKSDQIFAQRGVNVDSGPMEAIVANASKAIGESLSGELAQEKVSANYLVINSLADRDALSRVVRNHASATQFILLNAESFPMVQQTRYGMPVGDPFWSGKISWAVRLFDRDKAVAPDGKPVWIAKTNAASFSPSQCQKDRFKSCAYQLSTALVEQLRQDKLLQGK